MLGCALSMGCLSTSYRIQSDELHRLAATPPNARWQQVRAVQQMVADDHPPPDAPVVAQPAVLVLPNRWVGSGVSYASASRNRDAVHVGNVSGGGGSGGGGGGGSSSGNLDPRVVLVAVVLAGAVVFVLAGTEGARYDGWLELEPHEMLYLTTDEGVRAVPLSALTPRMAELSYGATVYEGSQPRFGRLGRAPLNRVGMTIQAAVSGAMVPTLGGTRPPLGIGGNAFVGVFPLQQLGIGLALDIATADGNLYGTVGGEVQVMPITYLGLYGGGSWAGLSNGGSSAGGRAAHMGVQVEVPFSTRLTLRLRSGASYADLSGPTGDAWLGEFSAGMSVY